MADLVRRRVPVAVGTSASSYDVDHLLRGIGLLHHFPVVVTADDVTRGKPDPEVYMLAARRLRADPAACLVFEDSVVGIHAARAAGMRAIGVATAYPAEELHAAGADRVIDRLRGPRVGVDRKPVSGPAFWENLYAQGEDGWELREAGPGLVAWLAAGGRLGRSWRARGGAWVRPRARCAAPRAAGIPGGGFRLRHRGGGGGPDAGRA